MRIDRVKHVCYDVFVPHEGNAYRPHILHPRRTIAYAVFFTTMKLFVIAFVVAIPTGTLASPEASNALMGQLIAQTNVFRQSLRVAVLAADARLAQSASAKAGDMVAQDYFGHWSPDGSGPERFIGDAGYPYVVAGENLALGYADAREIIDAWQASPAHLRNLIDVNFDDVGFGVQSGVFQDTPTLFVVQHLGKMRSPAPVPAPTVSAPAVTGHGAVRQPDQPVVDFVHSSVAWQEDELGTELTATVRVEGVVHDAAVEVRGYEIPLAPEPDDSATLTGNATIPITPDVLFRVITPPTLTVTSDTAMPIVASITWDAPLRPHLTIKERYTTASALLPQTLGPLLHTSRAIIVVAFILFMLAWLINFFVEIRRQHIDLLVPGGALVILLGFLIFV